MVALASVPKSRDTSALFEPTLESVYVPGNSPNEQLPVSLYQSSPMVVDMAMAQQMCREAKESNDLSVPIECGHLDMKRVAFTPRIGRRR